MPNPRPRPENLKSLPRCDATTAPLAGQNLSVRLTADVDSLVRSLPNKSAWLRRVITEAAKRELMGGDKS